MHFSKIFLYCVTQKRHVPQVVFLLNPTFLLFLLYWFKRSKVKENDFDVWGFCNFLFWCSDFYEYLIKQPSKVTFFSCTLTCLSAMIYSVCVLDCIILSAYNHIRCFQTWLHAVEFFQISKSSWQTSVTCRWRDISL